MSHFCLSREHDGSRTLTLAFSPADLVMFHLHADAVARDAVWAASQPDAGPIEYLRASAEIWRVVHPTGTPT